MTACVYMSLNKASLKGNTVCTMETGVAMERMLFSEQQKKRRLDSPLTLVLKNSATVGISRVIPEKHQYK